MCGLCGQSWQALAQILKRGGATTRMDLSGGRLGDTNVQARPAEALGAKTDRTRPGERFQAESARCWRKRYG